MSKPWLDADFSNPSWLELPSNEDQFTLRGGAPWKRKRSLLKVVFHPTPLKNHGELKSVGMMTFQSEWKVKKNMMFQSPPTVDIEF